MAEVLGVVASGIAVGTLAGKAAGSIVKLKDCWDQIKDAPDEISFLLRQIDSFNLVLSHIREGNRPPDILFNNNLLDQSLKLCEEGVGELAVLVDELATKIEMKGGWRKKVGGTKILLKKDELKRFKGRMKTAIHLLSLAYQCHTMTMIQLQPEIIVSRVAMHIQSTNEKRFLDQDAAMETSSAVEVVPQNSNPDDIISTHYDIWTSSTAWMKFLLGSFEYRSHSLIQNGRLKREFEAKYRLPCWVSQTTLHCQGYNYLSTWRIKCQVYRLLPDDFPFFEAIRSGDISSVQQMLAANPALVSDRVGFYEQNCLHVAVESGGVEMCRLLLDEGADPMGVDINNRTPFDDLLYGEFPVFAPARLDLCRQLMSTESSSIIQADHWLYDGPISAFKYLIGQIYPPYYQRSTIERMEFGANLIFNAHSIRHTGALVELSLCADGIITTEIANWKSKDLNRTLLHSLAAAIAFTANCSVNVSNSNLATTHWGLDRCSGISTWAPLVQKFVGAGADIHARDKRGASPLSIVLGTSEVMPFYRQNGLISWVTILRGCGIDLLRYGERERELGCPKTYQNIFSYGSLPSDWRIWYCEPTDAYAGHFWEMVERQIQDGEPEESRQDFEAALNDFLIPGAWMDDGED